MQNSAKYLIFPLLVLILGQMSCGFSPRKKDIKNKIKGTYCNDNHILIIEDSTYKNIKKQKGAIANTPYSESCTGKYSIVMEEGRWILRFHKDEHPQSIVNCQQEFTIWTEKEGYIMGQEEIVLRDLFDNTAVTQKDCK